MLIQAHRGACHIAPENTMEAFMLAAEMGADAVELDVQVTADGVLVICHDDTVDRTSNGTGEIERMTLTQLLELDFSCGMPSYQGVRIPTLKQVLAWAAATGLTLNIEIKPAATLASGIVGRTLALIEAATMMERTLISSFNHEILSEFKRALPGIKVGALSYTLPEEPWRYARDSGFDALHPYFGMLKLPDIVGCKEKGVLVHPWTVDAAEDIRALAQAGADAVITNRVDIAREALQSL